MENLEEMKARYDKELRALENAHLYGMRVIQCKRIPKGTVELKTNNQTVTIKNFTKQIHD